MSHWKASQAVEHIRVNQAAVGEQSQITCVADAGRFEDQTLTFPATAGATQGDFVVVENAAGDSFAIWLDIDADGTAPAGSIYTATDNQLEVDIATGDTAAQVATKVFAVIDGNITDVTVTDNLDGTLGLTQDKLGNTVAPVPKDTTEAGAGSITATTDTGGVASNYQSKYFTFKNGAGAAFYAWFNVNSEGSDPAPGGTGIAVALSGEETADAVATALAAAIDANANFDAYSDSAVVTMHNAASGDVVDIADGDASLTYAVTQEGLAAGENLPSGNRAAAAIEPSSVSAPT